MTALSRLLLLILIVISSRNSDSGGGSSIRWEDNIKMDLLEVGRGGVNWIEMAEDRDRWRALVNAVMELRVP